MHMAVPYVVHLVGMMATALALLIEPSALVAITLKDACAYGMPAWWERGPARTTYPPTRHCAPHTHAPLGTRHPVPMTCRSY